MGQALPSFYEHWLPAENPAPEAPGAFDCSNCFMTKPRGLTRDLGPFRESVKCCTFHPYLPSFTIGALLETPTAALEKYLGASRLTPLGATPKSHWRPTSVCETGRHVEDGCVFLSLDGRAACTIRDFRPSTCAAYVCRSRDGALGLAKWRSWEGGLAKFETTLAHLAAFELGYTLDDCETEFADVKSASEFYRRAFEVSGDIAYVED